jgi:hypothetical protein
MARVFTRNPRWLKWVVMGWVVIVWCATIIYAFNVLEGLRCKFTDIQVELKPDHPNRGTAAICLEKRSGDEIASQLPQLLALIGDETYASKDISLGLSRLYGDPPRQITKSVSEFAQDAIKVAAPRLENVEPIVIKIVERANQVKPRNPKTGEFDQTGGEGAGFLLTLLAEEYSTAGFAQEISTSLIAHTGRITNDAFWRVRHRYEKSYAQHVFELTRGKSPEAVAQVAKHEAEQAIESKNPPQISPLPAPTMQASGKAADAPPTREPRGQFWALRADPDRTIAGWSTIEEGSTAMCHESLPVLCIAARDSHDVALDWVGFDRLGIRANALDARIALTEPVSGTQLSSRSVGDAMCKARRGAAWRMAEHHDSLAATLPANAWRLVNSHYTKGGVLSARTSDADRAAMVKSNFWVAFGESEKNCWAR